MKWRAKGNNNKKNVLVVEDDAGIAGGLTDSLKQAGYAVDVCACVNDAWAALCVLAGFI